MAIGIDYATGAASFRYIRKASGESTMILSRANYRRNKDGN